MTKTCNHQWQFARDENKKGHLICDKCGKEELIESNISKPEVRKSVKNPNKYLCNPLDENSTLNMDKGSGGLTNTKNKSIFPFIKRKTKGTPTTDVHLTAIAKDIRKTIAYKNMDKGGQGESRKVGGHSYSPKPPNVHLKNLPKRPVGNPIDFPQELGYECPNCKSKDLDWSEYQGFIWCERCQRDYPSVLSMPNLEKAIEIYLEIITEKK